MTIRDIFILIQLAAPKRFSKYKKRKFLSFLFNEIQSLGYLVELKVDFIKGKWFRKKSLQHLIVGNLKNSTSIIIAGYDTPSKMILPNYIYYPFNGEKNQQNEMINMGIYFLISIALIIISYLVIFKSNYFLNIHINLRILGWFVLLVLSMIISFGIPNGQNFNKNTAAVAVLYKIIQDITDTKNQNTAFIFADLCSMSYEGYSILGEYIRKQAPKAEVIVLDCIGYGNQFLFATTSRKHSALDMISNQFLSSYVISPNDYKNSPLRLFGRCTYITCGVLQEEEVLVNNTRSTHDKIVDIDKLEVLESFLCNVLEQE